MSLVHAVHCAVLIFCVIVLTTQRSRAYETDLWRGITIDMMIDEEDNTFKGVSGRIVLPQPGASGKTANPHGYTSLLSAHWNTFIQNGTKYI